MALTPTSKTKAEIDQIVNDNIGLVRLMVGKLMRGQPPNDDLYDEMFQAGCIALYRVARTFDPNRGSRFSTPACMSIMRSAVQARRAYFRSPIAHHKICALVHDNFETHDDGNPHEHINLEEAGGKLWSAVARLPHRTQMVIVLRFSEKPLRLREIGEMLDLSKERVRQIERDGLRRLNRLLRHSGVAPVAHGP